MIKTCVTGLVLKDKNPRKNFRKSSSFSLQTALMSLLEFFKNPNPIEDLNSLGYLSHNLKTLILKIIVFL